MTDGTLELRGDFSTAAVPSSMITPTMRHRVRLSGTALQQVAFSATADHPQANRFQHVEVVNAVGVWVAQDARALGRLDLVGRMTYEAALTIPLCGSLLLRSGSYLDNMAGSIALAGTCTVEPGADGVGVPPAFQAP